MAAMARSRLTLGYCSRNWSRVSPPSKYSIRILKGTRVPRKTGSPPRISGSLTIEVWIILRLLHSVYHTALGPVADEVPGTIVPLASQFFFPDRSTSLTSETCQSFASQDKGNLGN